MSDKHYPLFTFFRIAYLTDIMGYHRDTLRKIRYGAQPLTDNFRKNVVAALAKDNIRLSQKILFGTDD